ncbi:MAG TPA: membrane bound O-acyl transferase family-domain-containing protein [Gemmataceae bacterium]|jgi:alginate O-acetyltransferase complex protein AlgI|nr:membrane bound O-acyl transferase family-domain-containing protein [Gemmataceae bacterium]
MAAYVATDYVIAWLIVGTWLGTLAAGFGITRLGCAGVARCAGWLLVTGSLATTLKLCEGRPAGVRMVTLCVSLLLAMKAVVSVESQAAGQQRLSSLRWFAFAILWVGMRPVLFAKTGKLCLPGAGNLIVRGLKRLALGMVCLFVVPAVWPERRFRPADAGTLATATALALIGLSLILHFGVFNILAGLWRLAGIDCRPLFRAPLLARSLTEFWGRRWNLAFSEMAAVAVVRPLRPCLGTGGTVMAAFLFSGVVHELAISVPVGAGYGGPFAYFALHGALVLLERGLDGAGWPIERLPWLGTVWTLGWLALPLPVLFHTPFLSGVVWPLLGFKQA